ncbi:hypothetical protein [Salinisphaera sp. Q1T1-3]|uniref:hypothetical protein n=1 Tax=Salinisphaera sp. Q1T1-3 TaxID=2321229 RepID=UPI000E7307CB|nr:hypothetical protein [Salinisphaera sp. Q1T1-3]RJS95286.1 hypothetical protein D3260_01670 [Salinisphaera sp. Q1T1-3]
MSDDRVIPFGREPTRIPHELFIPALTAGVNAQNLPAQLARLGFPAAEAQELQAKADAFVSALRRHLPPEIDDNWPDHLSPER